MNYSPRIQGLQLPLFPVQPYPLSNPLVEGKSQAFVQESPAKRVLGGDTNSTDQSRPPSTKSHACGWVEEKTVKRQRKSGDTWEGKQYWFTWEEPGGKHRCKYIPKDRLTDVEQSVYTLKRSIEETLQLLEKSARG
ncbi:hypothetical protein [Phormidesmis sp. 146-33]